MYSSSIFCKLQIEKIMNKQSYFITGTDTDAGKTVVTGLLGRYFKQKGEKVITQKWIQTGDKTFSADILKHHDMMGIKIDDIIEFKDNIMPYVLDFPASPHLAALKEDKTIDPEHIKNAYLKLRNHFDVVLVEGSGGIMVPVTEDILMIDICKDLNIPVILVVGNKLGAINHALLSIEVLRSKNLDLKGLIFNNICKETPLEILDDNVRIIKKIAKVEILGKIDHLENKLQDFDFKI